MRRNGRGYHDVVIYNQLTLVYSMCDRFMLFMNVDVIGVKSNFDLKT